MLLLINLFYAGLRKSFSRNRWLLRPLASTRLDSPGSPPSSILKFKVKWCDTPICTIFRASHTYQTLNFTRNSTTFEDERPTGEEKPAFQSSLQTLLRNEELPEKTRYNKLCNIVSNSKFWPIRTVIAYDLLGIGENQPIRA